jgi:PAS domain S-box-containing protein
MLSHPTPRDRFARAAAAAAFLVGCLVLLGWATHSPFLKSVIPGRAPMRADAAFAFLLCGLSLWGVAGSRRAGNRPARGPAAWALLVVALGALVLAHYARAVLWAGEPLLGPPSPWRMAPTAACAFLLLGSALLLLALRRRPLLAQALTVLAILLASAPCAGHLYAADTFLGGPFPSVALNAAVTFLVVGLGVLAASPDRGLVALLVSDGAAGSMVRWLLPAAFLPVLLGGLCVAGQRAGWYGGPFGLVLFALANGSLFAALVCWAGSQVSRTDARRRQSEEALRLSERRHRALVQASPQVLWLADDRGGGQALSWWEELTGQSHAQAAGWGWLAALHPDDQDRVRAEWARSLETKAPYHTEYRVRSRAGEFRDCLVRGIPLFDASGALLEWVGALTDVTDERRAQQALRESEERYRLVTDALPHMVWSMRADLTMDFVNQRMREYHGLNLEQLDADAWLGLVHPDDREAMLASVSGPQQRGEAHEVVFRARRHDGVYRFVLGRAVPMRDPSGVVVRWVGATQDIHDRWLAEHELRQLNATLEQKVAERTEALREGEERFRGAFDFAPIGMALVAPDGRFLRVNRSLCEIVGYTEPELLAADFHALTHPDDLAADLNPVRQILAGAIRTYTIEKRYFHKDGRAVPTLLSVSLVRDAHNDPLYFISQIKDISQRKAAEAELHRAKRAAEAANRAKGEFLANMSHEVRTPMNGILGMTELALETELTAEQREYLEMVRYSAESLLTILNDILDFSKIEAGKLGLDPAPFALRDALGELLKPLALRACAGGLQFVHRVAPDVPDALVGDLGRLRQVLVNLVGNAVKFTQSGEVAVLVSRRQAPPPGEGGVELEFEVRDTGIGIPADKLALIFAPFEQADGSTARRFGGTGLGLAISARLVELMRGRIWVESEVGKGSAFHFTAALARQPGADLPGEGVALATKPVRPSDLLERAGHGRNAAAGQAGTPRQPLRILLAEDNPVNQRVAVLTLQKQGHRVCVAGNGHDAVAALERDTFDLVLMDVQMPDMDGLEATAAVRRRENGAGRRTPIIALTAHAMKGDRERFLAAGMDGYLTKPLQPQELHDAIEGCVLSQETDDRVFDPAGLLEVVAGNAEVLTELLAVFRDECPRLMGQLLQAVAHPDAEQVRRLAHTLKGMLVTLGAPDAHAAVLRLEELSHADDPAGVASAFASLERQVGRLQQAIARHPLAAAV